MNRFAPGLLEAEYMDEPVYARPEAAAIAGCTDGQLRGILDRRLVELSNHNPGSGVVRLFTVRDIIKIAAASALANIGVPMRLLRVAGEMVSRRASEIANDDWEHLTPRQKWALFPEDGPTGPWRILVVDDAHPLHFEMLPAAICILQIDEVIKRTVARFMAKAAGRELPSHRGSFLDAADSDAGKFGKGL